MEFLNFTQIRAEYLQTLLGRSNFWVGFNHILANPGCTIIAEQEVLHNNPTFPQTLDFLQEGK